MTVKRESPELINFVMDIFSHGLWSSVIAQGVNKKKKERKFKPWLAAWWGVFPDVFAFTIPFAILLWQLIAGAMTLGDIPHPSDVEPAQHGARRLFAFTNVLYSISHSAVIFTIVFAVVILVKYLLYKLRRGAAPRVPWEMLAWLLHVAVDLPTHSYRFYPTPVLWPLSDWRFNGFSWGQWWFLLLDYSLLIVVYLLVRRRRPPVENKTTP